MIFALNELQPTIADGCFVAENAAVIGDVHLAPDSSVWFNCTLRGDCDRISIGARSNVQDGSVLHADTGVPLTLGEGVVVGHQVMLHGCTIGDNCLIGIQSVILNRVVIGKNCIVAAGSVIPEGKVFPDGVMIMGSPAVIKRELRPAEIQMIGLMAGHYVQNAQRFQRGLQRI